MSTKAERALFVDRWKGQTAVCIASGPSLTNEDCETVRAWRARGEGVVIVTNTTIFTCLWADVCYGMDKQWWMHHCEKLDAVFHGERIGRHSLPHRYKLQTLQDFEAYNNTGAGAVSLAMRGGVARVILLGFDVQWTGGKRHHHPDHPRGLGNAGSVRQWLEAFHRLRKALDRAGIKYVNCTRETALKWPRAKLCDALMAHDFGSVGEAIDNGNAEGLTEFRDRAGLHA